MSNFDSLNSVEFSICIASFNGEKYIKDQLLSILAQISIFDEIVISDNGSKDKTLEIIDSLHDKRIKVLHCETLSVVKNFENCLLNSSGKYIVLCDQDDIWLEGRLDAARYDLNSCDLSVVGMFVVGGDLKLLDVNSNFPFPVNSFLKTFYSNGFSGCCLAFRKDVLDIILPFPSRLPMHDWWIVLLAILFKKNIRINENKFILYRRHQNNVSNTTNNSNFSIRKKLFIRFLILYLLILRYLKIKFFLKWL